jgi:hypothetical protein
MKSNHGTMSALPQSSARPAELPTGAPHAHGWQRLGLRAAIAGGILLAAIAVSLMLSSCGGRSSDTSSSSTGEITSQSAPSAAVASAPVTEEAVEGQALSPGAGQAMPQSRPPDVAASVMDTLVAPGAAVEVVLTGARGAVGDRDERPEAVAARMGFPAGAAGASRSPVDGWRRDGGGFNRLLDEPIRGRPQHAGARLAFPRR